MPYMPGTNTGHAHVWDRPDGKKCRCGGPGLCPQCSKDKIDRAKWAGSPPVAPSWEELARDAIADLRRYAHDDGPERRLVSAEAYEEQISLIEKAHAAGKNPAKPPNSDQTHNT